MAKKISLFTKAGQSGDLAAPAAFDAPVRPALVKQFHTLQMANRRLALAHAKTRAEVRGGGKKPWKQKGTGRARHGSTRSPIWVGGGKAWGPRNDRNFAVRMPKEMRRQALFSILSGKLADQEIFAGDDFGIDAPSTKKWLDFAKNLPAGRRLLVVHTGAEDAVIRSARAAAGVKPLRVEYLNPQDLLTHDRVLFVKTALDRFAEIWPGKTAA